MKQLLLIRHAKSSWTNIGQEDFERPLNERGIRDAPLMAKKLIEKNYKPDALISSTAVRALETATFFAEVMGFKKKDIIQVPELYHAPPKVFKEVIQALPDGLSTVAIFGHNPGITEMANELTNIQIDNLPTCGIFGVEAEVKSWKNFLDSEKSFLFFYYPKAL